MTADDRKLAGLIRETLGPLGEPPASVELWPRLERRLAGRQTSIGKLDWLMAALVLGLLAGFPEAVMLVLYHF